MLADLASAPATPAPQAPAAAPPQRSIPLAIPNVGPEEAANLQACIADNWVSTVGPFVDGFERGLAAVSGVGQATAVAAGTMGLHVSLIALGVQPGDLVIAPSYTFIASINAIAHAHATPWFLDIDARTWTLDPAELARCLRDETKRDGDGVLRHLRTGRRVGAIMPVYTLGTPADMAPISAIAAEFGLPVLADAAAAIGATYRGAPIGGLADLTVYSFNGNKTITTGGGGAVLGPDAARVKLVRHLATTARVGADYDHDMVGFNYRMTNLEAAVGCAQLDKLQGFLARKRQIRETYDAAFAGDPDLSPFPMPDYATSAYWFSGVVLGEALADKARDILSALNDRGIQARPFWKPNHLQKPYLDAPRAALPVSEDLWRRVVTLPCSTTLTADDQSYVIDAVRAALSRLR